MLRVFRVRGDSMQPTLYSDDFVVALALFFRAKPGRLVVVRHPQYGVLVKRVKDINLEGACLLQGENAASLAADQMGWVSPEQILGCVLLSIRKPGARGE